MPDASQKIAYTFSLDTAAAESGLARMQGAINALGSTKISDPLAGVGVSAQVAGKAMDRLREQVAAVGKERIHNPFETLSKNAQTSGIAVGKLREQVAAVGNQRISSPTESITRGARESGGAVESLHRKLNLLADVEIGLKIAEGFKRAGEEVLELVQSYESAQAQIKTATRNIVEMQMAQRGVYSIAQDTRQEYTETASLFAKLSVATNGWGKGDPMAITGNLSRLFAVDKANGNQRQVEYAQRDFNEGLNGGNLGLRQLQPISREAPAVTHGLILAAQSQGATGVTDVESLAKALESKKLDMGKLLEGLGGNQVSGFADRMFSGIPIKFEQALEPLVNSARKFFGELDDKAGITATFGSVAGSIAHTLDEAMSDGTFTEKARAFGDGFRKSVVTAATDVGIAIKQLSPLWSQEAADADKAGTTIGSRLLKIGDEASAAAGKIKEIASGVTSVVGALDSVTGGGAGDVLEYGAIGSFLFGKKAGVVIAALTAATELAQKAQADNGGAPTLSGDVAEGAAGAGGALSFLGPVPAALGVLGGAAGGAAKHGLESLHGAPQGRDAPISPLVEQQTLDFQRAHGIQIPVPGAEPLYQRNMRLHAGDPAGSAAPTAAPSSGGLPANLLSTLAPRSAVPAPTGVDQKGFAAALASGDMAKAQSFLDSVNTPAGAHAPAAPAGQPGTLDGFMSTMAQGLKTTEDKLNANAARAAHDPSAPADPSQGARLGPAGEFGKPQPNEAIARRIEELKGTIEALSEVLKDPYYKKALDRRPQSEDTSHFRAQSAQLAGNEAAAKARVDKATPDQVTQVQQLTTQESGLREQQEYAKSFYTQQQSALKQAESMIDNYKAQTDGLRRLTAAYGQGDEAVEKLNFQLKVEAQTRGVLRNLDPAHAKAVEDEAKKVAAAELSLKKAQEQSEQTKKFMDQVGDAGKRAFDAWEDGSKRAGDAIRSMVSDLKKAAVNEYILNPVKDFLHTGAQKVQSGIGSLFNSATGNGGTGGTGGGAAAAGGSSGGGDSGTGGIGKFFSGLFSSGTAAASSSGSSGSSVSSNSSMPEPTNGLSGEGGGGSTTGSNFFSGISSGISNFFSGKAVGGDVYAGYGYTVGDGAGPEAFFPSVNGSIMTPEQTASMIGGGGGNGGGRPVTVHISTPNPSSFASNKSTVQQAIAAAVGQAQRFS